MDSKILFLVALFGLAASTPPRERMCDNEVPRQTPTHCSNLKYIQDVEKKQEQLDERITAVEGLVRELNDKLDEMTLKTEVKFNSTETKLRQQGADVTALQRWARDQARGDAAEIEQRLGIAEKQLREKKARLESLETETKAAFNDTQTLLSAYKKGLSELAALTQELRGSVTARLNVTETELGATVKRIQDNRKAFSAELGKQKASIDQFVKETGNKFKTVSEQLKTRKTVADKQWVKMQMLRNSTAELTRRLRMNAEARAKVAFSATVIQGRHVFTGPATSQTGNILVFDKVFTNVGNAYNCKSGLFSAPVKGVYHFSFMTFGYNSHTSGAILVKNGRYQVSTWEFKGPDVSDSTSNSIVLPLNAKDTVNIILWQGGKIYTATFSGFLLFQTA